MSQPQLNTQQRERRDELSRDLVDRALQLQQHGNTLRALEFLKSHGLDSGLIARVLLEPHRRRGVSH